MKDILEWIRDEKQAEVLQRKMELPVEAMHHALAKKPRRDVRSLSGALRASRTGIIAEFKRKSPSKGWIAPDALVSDIVPKYEQNGASACSVLGDKHFFGGSMEDVRRARQTTSRVPILYKEFIVDEYQVYEARMIGADAILLIAALLSKEDCRAWAKLANSLGLEVLLEIHNLEELDCLHEHVQVLGVNNRNLRTFETGLSEAEKRAKVIQNRLAGMERPPVLISESGLKDARTIRQLRQMGYEGFLIGEYFMRQVSPADELRELIHTLENGEAR